MSLKKYLTKKNIIIIICFLVIIIGIGSYFLINYLRVKNAVIKVTLDETYYSNPSAETDAQLQKALEYLSE